jgi:hypothetical protein
MAATKKITTADVISRPLTIPLRSGFIILPFWWYHEGNFLSLPQYSPVRGWSQITGTGAALKLLPAVVATKFHWTAPPLRLLVPVVRAQSAARWGRVAIARRI